VECRWTLRVANCFGVHRIKRKINSSRVLIILSCLLCLSACARPVGDYNYKITVEVETPEGLRKGSAVRQIKYQSTPFAIVQTGEAVMIDMPNGKTLFELMDIDTREIHFATFYWVKRPGFSGGGFI